MVGALLADWTKHLTVADGHGPTQAVFHHERSFILLEALGGLFGSLSKRLQEHKNSTSADGRTFTAFLFQTMAAFGGFYRAQIAQHGQSTFGESDVELVFTADDDDGLVVRDVAIHFI